MAKRPPPTKTNLFAFQRQLKFAQEGCELLHQKRDVLVMELMGIVAGFSDIEGRLRERLGRALDYFLPAYIQMGRDGIKNSALGQKKELVFDIEQHGIMGIQLPKVTIMHELEIPYPGTLNAPIALDLTVKDLQTLLEHLSEYVETIASVWRLSTEIEKTQKRINALENIFIPHAEEIIRWIKSVLEENEREEFFRRKLLASRTGEQI